MYSHKGLWHAKNTDKHGHWFLFVLCWLSASFSANGHSDYTKLGSAKQYDGDNWVGPIPQNYRIVNEIDVKRNNLQFELFGFDEVFI